MTCHAFDFGKQRHVCGSDICSWAGAYPAQAAPPSRFPSLRMSMQIPTATWFAMLWVYCGKTVCAFETTENINHIETKVELGITSGE